MYGLKVTKHLAYNINGHYFISIFSGESNSAAIFASNAYLNWQVTQGAYIFYIKQIQ